MFDCLSNTFTIKVNPFLRLVLPSVFCLRSFRSLGADKGATTPRVHSAQRSLEPQRKADTIHEQFNRL